MCRFTAYSGKKNYFLDEVLINPSNSLLNQSLHPKESRHHINADGFGVSWFNDKHNQIAPINHLDPRGMILILQHCSYDRNQRFFGAYSCSNQR